MEEQVPVEEMSPEQRALYEALQATQNPEFAKPPDREPPESSQPTIENSRRLQQEKMDAQTPFPEPIPMSEDEIFNQMTQEPEVGEHSLSEFEKLAKTGRESTSVTYNGQTIALHTLTSKEELEIMKRLDGFPQPARQKAYTIFNIAMALDSINGEPFLDRQPIGKDDDLLQYKFEKATRLFQPTINFLTGEYQRMVAEGIEKAKYAKKE